MLSSGSLILFLAFLRYPIRDRDSSGVVTGSNGEFRAAVAQPLTNFAPIVVERRSP